MLLQDGRSLLVELKPLNRFASWDTFRKALVGIRYAAEQGWGFVIADSRGRTLSSATEHEISTAVSEPLLVRLGKGPLGWREYREFRERHPLSLEGLTAFCLRFDYVFKETPWQLTALPDGFRWKDVLQPDVQSEP